MGDSVKRRRETWFVSVTKRPRLSINGIRPLSEAALSATEPAPSAPEPATDRPPDNRPGPLSWKMRRQKLESPRAADDEVAGPKAAKLDDDVSELLMTDSEDEGGGDGDEKGAAGTVSGATEASDDGETAGKDADDVTKGEEKKKENGEEGDEKEEDGEEEQQEEEEEESSSEVVEEIEYEEDFAGYVGDTNLMEEAADELVPNSPGACGGGSVNYDVVYSEADAVDDSLEYDPVSAARAVLQEKEDNDGDVDEKADGVPYGEASADNESVVPANVNHDNADIFEKKKASEESQQQVAADNICDGDNVEKDETCGNNADKGMEQQQGSTAEGRELEAESGSKPAERDADMLQNGQIVDFGLEISHKRIMEHYKKSLCQICGIVLGPSRLKEHENLPHDLVCTICGKRFHLGRTLERHMKLDHPDGGSKLAGDEKARQSEASCNKDVGVADDPGIDTGRDDVERESSKETEDADEATSDSGVDVVSAGYQSPTERSDVDANEDNRPDSRVGPAAGRGRRKAAKPPPPPSKEFLCDRCGVSFPFFRKAQKTKAEALYEKHSQLGHPHACPDCRLAFVSGARLGVHRHTEHGAGLETEHLCASCGRSLILGSGRSAEAGVVDVRQLKLVNAFLDHTEAEHGHSCQLCELAFTAKNLLTKHIKNSHADKKKPKRTNKADSEDEESPEVEKVNDATAEEASGKALQEAGKTGEDGDSDKQFSDNLSEVDGVKLEAEGAAAAPARDPRQRSKNTPTPEKQEGKNMPSLQDKKSHIGNSSELSRPRHPSDSNQKPEMSGDGDLMCGVCHLSFKDATKFRWHFRMPHIVACSHCSLKYVSREDLLHHQKAVKKEAKRSRGKFTCRHCDATFRQEEQYKSHRAVRHKEKCAKCHRKFVTTAELAAHNDTAHADRKSPPQKKKAGVCKMCGLAKPSEADYRAHVAQPHQLPCRLCTMRFVTKSRLSTHMMQSHNINVDSTGHECIVCALHFSSVDGLKAHSAQPHTVRCYDPKCSKLFISEEQRDKHCSRKHPGLLLANCTGSEGPRHRCRLCHRLFGSEAQRDLHQQLAHPLTCQGCELRFTVEAWLRAHRHSQHQTQALRSGFTCRHCNHVSGHLLSLFEHVTGGHEHVCRTCAMKFPGRAQLEAHSEENHMAEVVAGLVDEGQPGGAETEAIMYKTWSDKLEKELMCWINSPLVARRLESTMSGKRNSLRHQLFLDAKEREFCSRTEESQLFTLCNLWYLSLPPQTFQAVYDSLHKMYLKSPVYSLMRDRYITEYILCVLLPEVWIYLISYIKGLSYDESEDIFLTSQTKRNEIDEWIEFYQTVASWKQERGIEEDNWAEC